MKENNIKPYQPKELDVLYEDNHLIVLNKNNHDLVQGDRTGDASLDKQLKTYLKEKYNKPGNVFVGVVHRLDRPVSGAVIFAKTSKALSRFNELFKTNKVKKTYRAIIKEKPKEKAGTLVHFMKKNEKQNKSYCYENEVPGSKKAELDYTLIASSDRYHLLEVNLKTGRHHQIRAQLAHSVGAIKGDLKYGFARSNKDGGISLHAYSLEFLHPIKKELVKIVAPPPKKEPLWDVFESLLP